MKPLTIFSLLSALVSTFLFAAEPSFAYSFVLKQSDFSGGGSLYGIINADDKNNDDLISADELDDWYFEFSGDSVVPNFAIRDGFNSAIHKLEAFSLSDKNTRDISFSIVLENFSGQTLFFSREDNADGITETKICTTYDCWDSIEFLMPPKPGEKISSKYTALKFNGTKSTSKASIGKAVCAGIRKCSLEISNDQTDNRSKSVPEPDLVFAFLCSSLLTFVLKRRSR